MNVIYDADIFSCAFFKLELGSLRARGLPWGRGCRTNSQCHNDLWEKNKMAAAA